MIFKICGLVSNLCVEACSVPVTSMDSLIDEQVWLLIASFSSSSRPRILYSISRPCQKIHGRSSTMGVLQNGNTNFVFQEEARSSDTAVREPPGEQQTKVAVRSGGYHTVRS